MKKVTSILMAFVLMLTLIPTAWAEGESVGTMPELKDNVYKLENDVDLTSKTLTIDAKDNVTLDLNGHSIKVSNTESGGIDVYGKLTLMDSTDTAKDGTGNGKIWSDTQYTGLPTGFCAIRVCGNGHFIMESGLIDTATAISNNTANGQFAVGFNNTSSDTAATVTINGGHIKAGWYAVSGNGSLNMGTAKVVVNGGVLESVADYALYLPQNGGKAEINGGVIYGAAGGIAIKRGELTVNNGTITSKGTGSTGTWGDGTGNLKAAAINVDAAYGDAAVMINGGKMIAETNALFITNGTMHNGTITITGGTFSSDPTAYLAAGYTASKGSDGMYTLVSNHVAQIGDTKYVTLADAVAVGGDIKLLKDVTLTRGLAINKDITLDLNGKTLVRKDGLIFDVYSNMTIKNGTVKFSEKPTESKAAIWVNKTAKLTVESNVTVEAPDNCFDIAYDASCTAAEVILRGKLVGGSGVTMNGNIGAGTSNKLTVDGATIDVTGHGIYQAGCADTNFTINNSVITGGSTGIEVRAGKLTVTNSTITSTSKGKIAVNSNKSGTTTDGAGIAIAQHTTKQPIDVTIAGGTVTGEYAIYESNPETNPKADIAKVKVAVTGGTFNGKIYSEDVASFVTGGTFNTNPKDYVPSEGYTVAKAASGLYTVSTKTVKEDGTVENTSAVKLEVPATSNTVINTTVDKNDIETNKELTVTNGKTAVTINQTGVNTIGAIDLKLDIKADSKTPESANTAAYNKAMAGKDANSALVVNISLTNGASKLFTTDVTGAYALVTVPYSTDKADKLTVYYLNGSDATALTKVDDAADSGAAVNTFSYDATNKLITLKLPHFSEYLISTTATRSVVHHYGGSGTTTTTGTKTNSPGTFDAGVGIYAVSAILSVTGMAWVGTKQRKH